MYVQAAMAVAVSYRKDKAKTNGFILVCESLTDIILYLHSISSPPQIPRFPECDLETGGLIYRYTVPVLMYV
jgi:hypothetical protein